VCAAMSRFAIAGAGPVQPVKAIHRPAPARHEEMEVFWRQISFLPDKYYPISPSSGSVPSGPPMSSQL
jgi:hypothetical protein